jgi:crossover junction endodeoxyribonuclease RuvC
MSLTEDLLELEDGWEDDPVFVGIDPGVHGAIAVIAHGRAKVYDTPISVTTVRKKVRGVMKDTEKRDYLPKELFELIPCGPGLAVLEYVSAPRIGDGVAVGNVTSALKIGHGSGLWEMALVARGLQIERPVPRRWRPAVGLQVGDDKRVSLDLARSLFPGLAGQLTRQKDNGRAEALLMAAYARSRWGKAAEEAEAARLKAQRALEREARRQERAATPRGRVAG